MSIPAPNPPCPSDPPALPVSLAALLNVARTRGVEAYLCGPIACALALGSERMLPGFGSLAVDLPPDSLADFCSELTSEAPRFEADDHLTLHLDRAAGEAPLHLELVSLAAAGGAARGPAALSAYLETQDLTIQAVAIDQEGRSFDPAGGLKDWQEGTLRTVRRPARVFRDDPAALVRMARHIARYALPLDERACRVAARDSANILAAPRGAWFAEVNATLLAPRADLGLQWLLDVGVLPYILPEVASLVGFHKTCSVHHKDCWDHTLQVIQRAGCDPVTRWTALSHDIGKIWTRTVDRRGQVHFYRHEELGAVLFEGIAARFRMPAELASRIEAVIRLHGRVNLYESDWTESAVRRLMRDVEPHLEDLIRFSRADVTSKRPGRVAEIQRQLDELERRIEAIREQDAYVPPLPKGLGNRMVEELGLPRAPILGALRRALERLCAEHAIEAGRDASYYIEVIRERGIDALAALGEKRARG